MTVSYLAPVSLIGGMIGVLVVQMFTPSSALYRFPGAFIVGAIVTTAIWIYSPFPASSSTHHDAYWGFTPPEDADE